MPVLIRLLEPHDAPAYRKLRLRALTEDPAAFLSDAEGYAAVTVADEAERLKPSDQRLTLGAFVGGEVVGMAGLFRHTRAKQAHRGEVVGFYVAPEQRGQGVAQALLKQLIMQARTLTGLELLGLGVSETQLAAQQVYHKLGFEVWGVQPDALRLGEQVLAELHMQLRL
ncbi:GNAT family N-acetyltransferase [Deinococcus irradiatisoli]|uniref:GNAT family N-acetyltransferase n=1 Tax=Deinococcus irradiatisoli TaxID=2202254 RepID=A0A2Z3JPV8_9DEIO|nr:GNAT family N-acetyltransferase [Deinococcus irradiatisoli]AWN23508.1 GNAT family N-acetyltransferase [Deinococcus irradiatisoli]